MSLRTLFFVAVLSAPAGAGAPAAAQTGPDVRACADPDVTVRTTVQACTRLVKRDGLPAGQMAKVLVNLASALMVMGNITQALGYYDDAVGRDPSLFEIFPNRAYALEKAGYPDAAMRDYDHALKLRPKDRSALFGRGVLQLRIGRPEAAIADFERVLSRDNTDADAWFNRGLAAKALGRTAEAIRDFSAVLRLKPGDASAWMERGRAREQSDPATALQDFAKAISVAPEWPDTFVARGMLHDRLNNRAEADRDFLRAFELGYQAGWLTERITTLRGN